MKNLNRITQIILLGIAGYILIFKTVSEHSLPKVITTLDQLRTVEDNNHKFILGMMFLFASIIIGAINTIDKNDN